MTEREEDEYILGTDRAELDRLRFQHVAWAGHLHALTARAGFRAGQTLADLGCGPGFTTFELAHIVGSTGRVHARDLSERFLHFLGRESARAGLTQVVTSCGPVEELDLPDASLDGAYARWLFCWLPDPGIALARVARAVRPGGAIVLQEYLDWAAMRLIPESPAFTRVVAACMRSWRAGGGEIDIGARMPELARAHGLVVEHLAPQARIGRVGSAEWRWMSEFFSSYLPKLAASGQLAADELAAWQRDWEARRAGDFTWYYTPTMLDIVLRKP